MIPSEERSLFSIQKLRMVVTVERAIVWKRKVAKERKSNPGYQAALSFGDSGLKHSGSRLCLVLLERAQGKKRE